MTASLLRLWFDTEHGGDNDSRRGPRHARPTLGKATHAAITPAFPEPTLAEFEQLYRDRFEALCDYAYTILRSRDEARDAVQDVFVRLWDRRVEVWGRGEPLPYLVTATRHAALNILRRRAVEGRYEGAAARNVATDPPNANTPDAETMLDRVFAFIEVLPDRSREVLLLRWRHGLSLEEIAVTMQIGVASVRVAHARALAMLRERLGIS